MNPELDPNKTHEIIAAPQKQQNVVQQAQVEEKPKIKRTLPAILNSLVKPDTIVGDLCIYFVFPTIEQGLHKVLSALIGHYILDQNIKPSNQKNSGGIYIYSNGQSTDYTSYSRASANVIDTNGVRTSVTNKEYRGSTQSVFRLQHFAEDDYNHVNPLPWSWADVEAKNEQMNTALSFALEDSGWASVQEVFDAAGLSGAPPTAVKWGWKSINNMSVQLDKDDNTVMIIYMGSDPVKIV